MITMHITSLMKDYHPVYPANGTWEDTLQILLNDPVEKAILDELLNDLSVYGEFRTPILLSKPEDEEGDKLYVRDGTHRAMAHYLHPTQKTASVQVGYVESGGDDDFYPVLVTRLTYPQSIDDATSELLFDNLRSFKLNEEIWITSDIISTTGNSAISYWDSGLPLTLEAIAPYTAPIQRKIQEILGVLGQTPVIETVLISSEAEDDAFNNW